MSSDAQAGTQQQATPENSNAGQGTSADGSGLNAQQQKEYMTLKQKAEDYNKLKAEAEALHAQLIAERNVRMSGNAQATDPELEDIRALQEQAAYDPLARQLLKSKRDALIAQFEAGLAQALMSVPEAKRNQVAGLVRTSSYQLSVSDALDMVTDPETKTLEEQLREANDKIARMLNAKPNGSSPAATTPASADAGDDAGVKEMKLSEYQAALRAGGERARELMKAAGSNRLKLVLE